MKKLTIVLIFSLLGRLPLVAQNTFQHSYGVSGENTPSVFTQTYDKGFALLGSLSTNNYGYLIKVDSLGNKKWSKTYNPFNTENITGLIQTKDSGYLVTEGFTLVKLDSVGNVQWAKKFGYYIRKAMQVSGGYILAGGGSLFLRLDTSGNILWTSNSVGGQNYVYDIMQFKYDSCFYLLSTITSTNVFMINKVSKTGKGIWSRRIFGAGNSISADPDGKTIDVFICNQTKTNIWFSFDTAGILKRSWAFPYQWDGIYFYQMNYLHPNTNSSIFVLNSIDTLWQDPNYNYHIILFDADSMGKIKWSKIIGGVKTDMFSDLLFTNNSSISVFGSTQNFGNAAGSFYLIKTDSIGNSSCNVNSYSVKNLYHDTVLSLDTCNYPFNVTNITAPIIDTIIAGSLKDTNFNACSCYPPHAGFYYDQYGGNLFDSSTWATNWHWSFGNGTYDSLDVSPHLNYKDTGIYTVCLTVKNTCGADTTCQNIDYQLPTVGIKTITIENNKINLYPNPNNGIFNIKMSTAVYESKTIEIYNTLGEKIYNTTFSEDLLHLVLGKQPPGIYLYRIIIENGNLISNGKFIIQ